MPDEEAINLEDYYNAIHERGWACWIHGMKAGFIPQITKGWRKRIQKVSDDRQVTVCWDPTRFTDDTAALADNHEMIEVYRNETHRVVLFPAVS